MIVEHVAKVVHEAHRAYCETLGKYGDALWEVCTPAEKQKTIDLVNIILTSDSEYGACDGPADLHRIWVARKLADGWKYGDGVEDKTSRLLVDWDKLPMHEQMKNYLTYAVVRGIV